MVVITLENTTISIYYYFFNSKGGKNMASFYEWITDYVKEENYWVKEDTGISYYFC